MPVTAASTAITLKGVPLLGTSCSGTKTCKGATGWGKCKAGSTADIPDGKYKDENCDGIDGELTKGIFVATSGSDVGTCGLHTSPCKTINYALDLADKGSLE